jgi:hypothetical protein
VQRLGQRKRVFLAVVPLVVAGMAMAGTGAADGLAGPYVSFIDASTGTLSVGQQDGSLATPLSPAGVETSGYSVSQDGSAFVAIQAVGTFDKVATRDATTALVMTRNGESREISTYCDLAPMIAPDGSSAWFVSNGDLYRYDWDASTTTQLTTGTPFAVGHGPDAFMAPQSMAVLPEASEIEVVWASFNSSGNKTGSAVQVVSFAASPATVTWQSTVFGPSGPSVSESFRPFAINRGGATPVYEFYFAVCPTPACDTWSVAKWSGATAADGFTAVPGFDNTYDIRPLGTLWYAWKDSGTGAAMTSSYATTSDLTVPPTTWHTRSDGAHTFAYQPSLVAPQESTTISNPSGVQGHVYVATPSIFSGSRVVYVGFGLYLHRVGPQTFAKDAAEIDRGTVQYSFDGKNFRKLATTTGANQIPWPGLSGAYGNGQTPVLNRNTWLRWVYAGDLFTKATVSPATEVFVSPTFKVKVAVRGGLRTVSGRATRFGGQVGLYKGSKRLATTTISNAGTFSFKARSLPKGVYRLITVRDKYWNATIWEFVV